MATNNVLFTSKSFKMRRMLRWLDAEVQIVATSINEAQLFYRLASSEPQENPWFFVKLARTLEHPFRFDTKPIKNELTLSVGRRSHKTHLRAPDANEFAVCVKLIQAGVMASLLLEVPDDAQAKKIDGETKAVSKTSGGQRRQSDRPAKSTALVGNRHSIASSQVANVQYIQPIEQKQPSKKTTKQKKECADRKKRDKQVVNLLFVEQVGDMKARLDNQEPRESSFSQFSKSHRGYLMPIMSKSTSYYDVVKRFPSPTQADDVSDWLWE
ncbi:hypothetical protein Poli38472_014081 [Pythium oligandrum]|uniref:Uncharacterized protein n=1 Tax=Pythium oligandrum TaxID=41045 RepID=A0A8K1CPB4_PYTOL|nr:hypothetical protein Poli38472_014081 [Pythium oligandrum]|eukprot:TMW66769.1 hypothetical protein Poli38472_014081 [Pythium oligandrum]